MSDPMVMLVRRAIAGDHASLREVVEAITPAIHTSVGHTLRRSLPSAVRGSARQEVEDLAQEVLVALFANKGKRLLQWDPDRGLTLPRYVELVSRRIVFSIMRSHRRSPWANEPIDPDDLAQLAGATEGPERSVAQKELLAAVLAVVEAELSKQGREVFRALIFEELSVEEICARNGMTANAVHIWRSRIAQHARAAARRILRGDPWDD
jgi:RNA polymerase sigma factor (sigma-70 family)